ncbi:MAG: BON domain-containing protein [Candidatus Acidiferrales bacterium]
MRSLGIPLAPFFVIALAVGCATKPNDAQLATNLKAQMFSDPQTKSADLQVAVKNGVVTLSGTAPSDAARYEAYKLATSMPGVSKVNDQVTVQAPETAEATPPAAVAPSVKTSPRRESKRERERERLRRVSRKHPHHAATIESATKAPAQPATAPAPTPAPTTPAAAAITPATPPAAATSTAAPAPTPGPPPPPPPVTAIFPAGTTVEIQTVDAIDSKTGQAGDQFQATLAKPLTWDSRIVVPKGANVYLRLVAAQNSGQYKGQSELQLRLVRLEFQGTAYPLTSATFTQAGGSRSTDTAKKVGGGAVLGAIIGAIAGGGKGAAIGGAAGAGAGGVYQGASKPKQVRIPAETVLDFKLDQPLNIPVPATGGAQ